MLPSVDPEILNIKQCCVAVAAALDTANIPPHEYCRKHVKLVHIDQ